MHRISVHLKNSAIALSTALLMSGISATAQFSLPKPSIPDIGQETGKTATAQQNAVTTAATSAALPEVIYESYPPNILLSTLMNEGIVLQRDGNLEFPSAITAVFLPTKDASGQEARFGINEGDHRLTSTLYDGNGKEIDSWYWTASVVSSREPMFRTISSIRLDGSGVQRRKMNPGNYRVDFAIDGKPFYNFPFSVIELIKGDAYSPNTIYGIDGPWNDYGYLYIPKALPGEYVTWKQWFRNENPNPVINEYDPKITMSLKRNSKVIAQTNKAGYSFNGRAWKRYDFGFKRTDDPHQPMLKGEDLFNNPGKYQLEVSVDDKTSVYEFEVRNGQIQYQGRQVREGTDPQRFIEGGRDAWWRRRNGAKYD